jgi:Tfp pilus assembly protein PilF
MLLVMNAKNWCCFDLWQCKQDLEGAEEYYSRAILADPNDGEVLSQYGKLIWELHHDEERASSYFERAVQASPDDRYKYSSIITLNSDYCYTFYKVVTLHVGKPF